ncbi:LINE-type retrotransposon LIb DNA [Gossypium australe]|uniref:LINE-type retrotransposon LIb DNA n=1 Tax=Gossypium australe TaxID=47621 RepID=A0A5B6WMD1_9ROSI|nr:LINE-type retrotransposon LIb DNA [Gossypium australe]
MKNFNNKGKGIVKKWNKALQQSTRLKTIGVQRVSLKESMEKIAESLSVLSNSNFDLALTNKVGGQKEEVKDWNRDVYGFLGNRKRKLMKSLNNIQKDLERSSTTYLIKKNEEIRNDLENILEHEDLLWRQKARCDWLKLGDRNTNFFHSRTIKRRKFNRITTLRIDNEEWCSDQNTLQNKAVEFFGKLYGEVPIVSRDDPNNSFSCLKPPEITFLNTAVSNEEIKKALFDMAPLKALGSDGFHALFFQSQWDILGEDVCQWVKGIFEGKMIEPELNNTLIVLIPKKVSPEDFSHFRPISLCSVLYKLVMKVIANRFKIIFPKLVSQEQAGFIAGRNIFDNIIVAQEVIHSMRCNRKERKWMAVKMDLEKAYDRISWDFINVSLIAAGIPSSLLQTKPRNKTGMSSSPYLFVLCMEWLGHHIHSKMKVGTWDPIRLSRSGPSISHLFFADDLVIFYKAHIDQARLLDNILSRFSKISGHKISARKSSIFFSKNTGNDTRNQISQPMGFKEVQNLGTYLGVPLLHKRVTKSTLNFVVDKIRRKLQSWDARKLSFAGRITLAQSVLISIPNYFMQTMMIPKGVCDDIERLVRQFIWGYTEGNSKMALVGWDTICQPRARGGLGIRHLNDQNSSFFMKIGFNLATKSDVLLVQVLRSKYSWKDHIPENISRNQGSHLWRSLSKLWPSIRENLIWSIGDGARVRYWKDPWILGMGPLISKIPSFSNLNLDCCVRDMVNMDGSWNLDLFRVWVSKEMISRITSIPPPHPDSGADRVIWARSETGGILETAVEVSRPTKSKVIPLLEDLLHVIRDCPAAKDAWMLALPEQLKQRFFTIPFQDWFIANLNFHDSMQGNDITWSCLFGLITWRLWNNRNLLIFQNIAWTATEVVKVSNCWARQYESQRGDHKNIQQSLRLTNNSDGNWVYLSTNGAVSSNTRDAAVGGVARDHKGNWLMGFNRFLGTCSPFEAELWGIMDGILILLNKGYRRIVIVTDNLEAAQNLTTLRPEESGIAILRRTQRIIQSEGEWKIKHVSRNMNMVTDCLAKLSLNWKNSLQVMAEAPKEIADLLQADKANGYFM